ncbi:GGDEF domain-containing protein [Bacillus sp. 31A1R]|uniref:GGDEF domain-containing protein n=1 Tax=Robertmurraya mangrovi TaxID=3098077 RepID=A0ABU5ITX3_9BACI|nr:GGDEF domain-containing protein [Bacillus sp. 31A1R]MDZ5470584.1 GGDEF domain-containing protein [Bacillus sp. 31A1R]
MITFIGDIAESVPCVEAHQKSSEIYDLFERDLSLEGLVVTNQSQPVGLVMKTKYYHKLSSKYGFDIYMGRNVELLMEKTPLIVDYYMKVTEVSSLAMAREQDDIYDSIIVVKNQEYYGVVNIKNLLIKIAEDQVFIAHNTNPLTGLPGNTLIKEQLNETLGSQRNYTIMYADLDNFKAYNDIYGFSKGDDLIRETGNLLNKYVLLKQREKAFVGHIGGDDYIAILPHYEYESICQAILEEFKQIVLHYYDQEDLKNGYVTVKNRKGIVEQTPLCSLSIAVITNKWKDFKSIEEISEEATRLKGFCKSNTQSCYISNGSILEKDCSVQI